MPSASKAKLLGSCREYKEANPDAKDGTYVLAAQSHFMDNDGKGNLEYSKRGKATMRPEMKVYCDMYEVAQAQLHFCALVDVMPHS